MTYIDTRRQFLLFDIYSACWRLRTSLQKLVFPDTAHKYLFILSGAASGSTLLHEMLSQAEGVAILTDRRAREGKNLPVVRDLMVYNDAYNWQDQPPLDWLRIHEEYLKYWNSAKPIFLDKVPAFFFQAERIAAQFKPTYFICLHRNPYSQVESFMRKSTMSKADCIRYTIDVLRQQRSYLESLEACYSLPYAELTNDPQKALNGLRAWMPELGQVKLKREYSAHNIFSRKMEIKNLDPAKIARLSSSDIQLINRSLYQHEDLMQYFGYDYIEL